MRGGNNLAEALMINQQDSTNRQNLGGGQPMSIAMRLKKNRDALLGNH